MPRKTGTDSIGNTTKSEETLLLELILGNEIERSDDTVDGDEAQQ